MVVKLAVGELQAVLAYFILQNIQVGINSLYNTLTNIYIYIVVYIYIFSPPKIGSTMKAFPRNKDHQSL